jgi:uncharacterized membrane protein YidH (DUF202 family)
MTKRQSQLTLIGLVIYGIGIYFLGNYFYLTNNSQAVINSGAYYGLAAIAIPVGLCLIVVAIAIPVVIILGLVYLMKTAITSD